MSVVLPPDADRDLVRAALAGADAELAASGCAGLAARRWDPGRVRDVRRRQLVPEIRHAPGVEVLGDAVLEQLKATAAATWAANVEALGAADAILGALRDAGIPTMAFKGCVLAVSHRPDLAHRSVGDLDLLVEPDQVPAAAEVLARCGLHGGPRHAERLRHGGAWEPGPQGPPIAGADLHWRVTPTAAAHDEVLWRDAVAAPPRCGPALAPAVADHLVIVLATAGERGSGAHLRWMVDAVRLVADPALDWDRVVRTAVRWGRPRRTAEALAVAREVVHLAVPVDVVAHLGSRKGERLARLAESTRWWKADPESMPPLHAAARLGVVAVSSTGSLPGAAMAVTDHVRRRTTGARPGRSGAGGALL